VRCAVAREKPVPGFDYKRGVGVVMTPTEWRAILLTHTRRVDRGETFFINPKTKKTEYEAYSIIAVK
jgi:hypothetical protein